MSEPLHRRDQETLTESARAPEGLGEGVPASESLDDAGLRRRMLMAGAGLIGAAALSRVAQAGPLNPPLGPISSTGRTTTEAYDAARKGWIEINATNTPPGASGAAVISQPGCYYLAQNLNAGPAQSAAILVTVGGVEIDLNGFALNPASSSATAAGVVVSGFPAGGLAVRNGRVHVRSGATGISFECDSTLIENVQIVSELALNQPATGINLRGSVGSVIRGCSVNLRGDALLTMVQGNAGAGGTTVEDCVFAGFGNYRAGCELPGSNLIRRCRFVQTTVFGVSLSNGSVVQDCVFQFTSGTAINVGTGATVERCTVQAGGSGTGIAFGNNSRVAHCRVDLQGTPGTCVKANGGNAFITDNELVRASIGVDLTGFSGCMVFRNQVLGVTNPIAVNFGGNWYPNATTAGINVATNPFANFFG